MNNKDTSPRPKFSSPAKRPSGSMKKPSSAMADKLKGNLTSSVKKKMGTTLSPRKMGPTAPN